MADVLMVLLAVGLGFVGGCFGGVIIYMITQKNEDDKDD